MNSRQSVEKMTKKLEKKDERRDQISFKLAAEDKLAFDVSVRQQGEDLTSVLRSLVRDYIAKTMPEKAQAAADRRRAELHAAVVRGLREYAIRNNERPSMLRGLEELLELKRGALSELANSE